MKKIILFCLGLVAMTAVQAQVETETMTVKAVKKGEEPQQVMNAIKADFPKAIVQDLGILPSKLYGEQWAVSFDDNLDGQAPDTYLVNLKEGNETYSAVYDKDGTIKSSKHFIAKANMDSDVASAIKTKYPGWNVIKDSEKITYKSGSTKDIFRAEIQKDKMKRSLFITDDGKIIKDNLVKHS